MNEWGGRRNFPDSTILTNKCRRRDRVKEWPLGGLPIIVASDGTRSWVITSAGEVWWEPDLQSVKGSPHKMFITNKGGNANFLTEKAGSTISTLWSTFISPEMEQTDPCASVCEVLCRTPHLCCAVWVKSAEFEFNHEKTADKPKSRGSLQNNWPDSSEVSSSQKQSKTEGLFQIEEHWRDITTEFVWLWVGLWTLMDSSGTTDNCY